MSEDIGNHEIKKECRRSLIIERMKKELPDQYNFDPKVVKKTVEPLNIDKKYSDKLVSPIVFNDVIDILFDQHPDINEVKKKMFKSLCCHWDDLKIRLRQRQDFSRDEAFSCQDEIDEFCIKFRDLCGSQRFTNYVCILSTGKI